MCGIAALVWFLSRLVFNLTPYFSLGLDPEKNGTSCISNELMTDAGKN